MTQDTGTRPTSSRVLVIDDEDVVHASLRKILSRLGYGVEGVLSARAGLTRIENDRFDLIITDLMMPQMNGIELLQELRSRGCTTPVLMITGYPTIRTAVQAMRLGAVDYVAKPFTRKELLSPVKRALRIKEDPVGPHSGDALFAECAFPQPRLRLFSELESCVCAPHRPVEERLARSCNETEARAQPARGCCEATSFQVS